MKTILTTTGEKVLIDNEDFSNLSEQNWYVKYNKDVKLICTTRRRKNKKYQMILMHREVLGLTDPNQIVIHRNGNPLDNRKSNLFTVDRGKQNSLRKRNYNTKLFKGVHYKKESRKYIAAISKDGIKYALGSFETAEKAAKMYDKAALLLHGRLLAKTNKSLGLLQYKQLPSAPIEFKVQQKGHHMIGTADKTKVAFLRKILKKMNRLYGYTEIGKMLKYNSNTISRFIRKDRNLRSDAVDFLYSGLSKNRKALEKVGIILEV
ncbi:AP2 domain-containing protein [Leptospira stimsonii]|uniref:AP2/ERF domain-containing protein n=1 Tax=Leptospira stimsonii TaxID=2202203 RepID=A0ABY2N339_9LEPT|nr:AP2 domain-containing protein [Leptospira stimsonii]TGK20249.1 hypothetical protein EHO98_09915 [Leptospira stimsonii]TGM14892.1 hypothetical protein EHQ90_10440 [Leptospira stimsonii]